MNVNDMRSLMTFLEGINYNKGVYCSAQLSDDTKKQITQFCIDNDIPNIVPENEMHCTLIYSKKGHDDFDCETEYNNDVAAKFSGFEMFGKDKDTLVLKIKSNDLTRRHNEMMDEYDLQYDFDTYIPHITLSYDAIDFDHTALPKYTNTLKFIGEESSELETDWKPDTTKKTT